MIVTTLHETTFAYARPIERTFTETRLWPISDTGQTCREFSLTVDPMRPLVESRDYFGNMTMSFNILPPHKLVVVSGRSVVETHRKPFVPQPLESKFETQRAHFDFLSFDGPIEYSNELEIFARDAGLHRADENAPWFDAKSLFAAAQKLNSLVYERFTYSKDSTHVHTRISEVFAHKSGVCQDFAHIFIAVCRAAKIPCRYVSGYLVTRRAMGGEGASHAWVEVLIPNHGWCAFDPTNNLLANDSYIKLAAGRDYRDVTPTRGLFKGNGVECYMSVRVHMLTEDAESSTRNPENDRELVG